MTITIDSYSDYSLVVRGDTRLYKKTLLDLEGKFNANLKGGAGWIFSKKKSREALEKLQGDISSGKISPEESSESEEREQSGSSSSSSSGSRQNPEWVSHKSFLALLARVERLEQICSHSPFVNSSSSSSSVAIEEDDEREADQNVTGLLRKKKTKN